MPSELQVAVVLNEFTMPSPGQQLLDRFLMGYAHDGSFVPPARRTALFARRDNSVSGLATRAKEHGLIVSQVQDEALSQQGRVIISGEDSSSNARIARAIFPKLPRGARCFIYGSIAPNTDAARELLDLADRHDLVLASGTASGTAFRLPEIEVSEGSEIERSLILSHGPFPEAEVDQLDGLSSVIGHNKRILRTAEALPNANLWDIAYSPSWRPLLAAALSRSNNLRGDALKDGRTQDILGLQLIEKLAVNPRGWLLRHTDGSEALHLVLDGAVHDMNFAIHLASGQKVSAQLYRPPPPAMEHFSRLTRRISGFFSALSAGTHRAHLQYLAAGLEAMHAAAPK